MEINLETNYLFQRFVVGCIKNILSILIVKRVTKLAIPKKNVVSVFPYLIKLLFEMGNINQLQEVSYEKSCLKSFANSQ